MKIVFINACYSKHMGYAENCLPKAMASLGHEVYVVTSNLNVYGNEPDYYKNYGSFLGPANQGVKTFKTDGYTVIRLKSRTIGKYIFINGLFNTLKKISPDIVHSFEIASINMYLLALIKSFFKFRLFTETHQHRSVTKPYLWVKNKALGRKIVFKLTRTIPIFLSSLFVRRCYAISIDCAEVANKLYGVPKSKLIVQSLGTDTDLFTPAITETRLLRRNELRLKFGYSSEDIVCIYTGRFTNDKNPLLLAKAVGKLADTGEPFKGLFIGDGPQVRDIEMIRNNSIIRFVPYYNLPEYYSLADIGVWPLQESTSMLDAAACGLPLIVSDTMGDIERITNNGLVYKNGDPDDLSQTILSLKDIKLRQELGKAGRMKMVENYSWTYIAKKLLIDYMN